MKKGTFIEEEKNLYEKHSKGECRSELGSIGNINNEERRRLKEEQKKLLDQQRVDEEAQGYKGRPKNKNLDTPTGLGTREIEKRKKSYDMDILYILVSGLGTREIEKRKKSYDMDMVHLPLLAFLSMANKAIKHNVKVWCYDYIALGKQILQGDFMEGFNEMRGFFLGSGGHGRIRNNKACAWSVDLCLVDLPTGSSVGGVEGVPPWNILTDDHYLYSLGVAAASMDDNGWTLVMCSASSVAMVEQYARRVKLEICFRWVATTSKCYSINAKHGFKLKGQAVAYELKQSLDSYMFTHYLPSSSCSMVVGKSGSWRGFMEKSPTFILMFFDFLSLSSATLLELGAGIGPLMRAALHTGRRCLVIDNDNELCDNLLTPFVKSYAHDAGPSIPHVIDDDVETILKFSAPMDWLLPCFATDEANFMATRDDIFYRPLQDMRQVRSFFVDDIAEEDIWWVSKHFVDDNAEEDNIQWTSFKTYL
ncbi:hypothetical protein L7F22_069314 [Adiantum nelumboides]|nr:hypothetical protein [Adiantum nelumboides]